MHPRNRHSGRYDLEELCKSCPELRSYVVANPRGQPTVDFADPAAVKTLNRALLKRYYGIAKWDIPAGYLCPPIPGRAEYIHYAADLLSHEGVVPRGPGVRVLDIGVGASCIYPIIGRAEYGWSFVGSETDPAALDSAWRIVDFNEGLKGDIRLRLQESPERIYNGLLRADDLFDLSMCNPPFHGSAQEVEDASRRKWKNLGHGDTAKKNFGGQAAELWCPGGEAGFTRRMIAESIPAAERILWFSTLVSDEDNLPGLEKAMKKAGAREIRTFDMSLGQKKTRVVAWTFADEDGRSRWREKRAPLSRP